MPRPTAPPRRARFRTARRPAGATALQVVGAVALCAALTACSAEPRQPPSAATPTPARAAATAPAPAVEPPAAPTTRTPGAAPTSAAPTTPTVPPPAASPTPEPPTGDLHPCEQGIAIHSPETKPDLVADCKVLLAIKDELAGRAELDWSGERTMFVWEGIDVRDDRVVNVLLRQRGLTGSIPPEISRLTGLRILHLHENRLTGPIPPELGEMTRLESLWLGTNELTGSIPRELGAMTSLGALIADRNQLTGAIPPELGQLGELQVLILSRNGLTGPIPAELGRLSKLETLSLTRNRLTGPIPSGLGALAELDIVNLRVNPIARCFWPPGEPVVAPALAALGIEDCASPSVAEPAPRLTDAQTIAFAGEVTEERRAALRAAVEDVAVFYRLGHGLEIPDFRLYFAPDAESADAVYEQVTGRPPRFVRDYLAGTVTMTAEGPVGIVLDRHDGEFVDRLLSHEYYHLFQHGTVAPAPGVGLAVPAWLSEGTAEYASGLYIRDKYRVDVHEEWRAASLRYEGDFAELARDYRGGDHGVAALAVDWLVTHSGDRDSHARYWRLVGAGEQWHDAFVEAFGISAGDFLEPFEAYRAAVAVTQIRGVVLDPAGAPLAGATVVAYPDGPNTTPLHTTSAADGAFELAAPRGTFTLFLARGNRGGPALQRHDRVRQQLRPADPVRDRRRRGP